MKAGVFAVLNFASEMQMQRQYDSYSASCEFFWEDYCVFISQRALLTVSLY